jgi:hypothetical protein
MSAGLGVSAGVGSGRLERARRALGFSGRRLVETDAGWAVLAGGDRRRRPIVQLSDGEGRELIACGAAVPAAGGGYVGCGEREQARGDREAIAMAGEAVFVAVGLPRRDVFGAGFAGLAKRAARGEGPLSVRQARAGVRLIADAEQSRRDARLTMDWEAGPADRVRRGAGGGGLAEAARAAAARLAQAERKAGAAAYRLAWAACVEQMSLAKLEATFGYERRTAGERLSEALEAVAQAYEG